MGIQKWRFWLCKASVGKKWPFGRGPKKGTFRAQNIFLMVWAFFSRNFGLERVFSRKTGKKLKIDLLGPTFGDPGPGLRPPKVGLRRSILGQIPVFREKTLSRPKFREKNAQSIKKMHSSLDHYTFLDILLIMLVASFFGFCNFAQFYNF